MAVSLQKGQKISLTKAAKDSGVTAPLTVVNFGLGWDTQSYDGGADFDLDASAFLVGSNGKVRTENDFVFYGTKHENANGMKCDLDESVIHTGDNLTGAGEGDDETIMVDLTKVPVDVEKVAIAVTIYDYENRKQNFGQVQNSFIRAYDPNTNTEILRYDLGEDFSIETAVVVAELYRKDGDWKFNPIGSGWQGGLAALCSNYGINAQ